jgi:membrane-bound serine protease (ClpP class)
MIGEIGIARTAVDGDGKVFVHGELWNAMAASSIPQGARVRVRGIEGMRVVVEAVDA